MIRKVVQQIFQNGYITIEAEQQLKLLFENGCDLEDLDALTDLQQAVMYGHIKRVSRHKRECNYMKQPVGLLSR